MDFQLINDDGKKIKPQAKIIQGKIINEQSTGLFV